MQAFYLPSARSEGNTVYNLADEPAEQSCDRLYIGQIWVHEYSYIHLF